MYCNNHEYLEYQKYPVQENIVQNYSFFGPTTSCKLSSSSPTTAPSIAFSLGVQVATRVVTMTITARPMNAVTQ